MDYPFWFEKKTIVYSMTLEVQSWVTDINLGDVTPGSVAEDAVIYNLYLSLLYLN